ncbi:MAG: hypothetical protein Q4B85_11070 [Lachnospiraceae bacterium]|nr:hypothetical protein [Lachnospiraceae bacterium]
MLASAGVKAPADELPKAAMVHEQVAKRIANVRFTLHCRTRLLDSMCKTPQNYVSYMQNMLSGTKTPHV